jgi:hypothetical protein
MVDPIIYMFLIRLLVPLLIFRWNFYGFVAAMLGDTYADVILLDLFGRSVENYHTLDKMLDIYMLTIALIASLRFDKLEKSLSIALYGIRAVGLLFFFLTNLRVLLVFFPNVFEFYFLFIAAAKKFWPSFKLTKKNAAVVIAALAVPKLILELLMHHLGFDMYLWGIWIKIKTFLLDEMKIPEDEIAIKTAKNDEIKGIDLLSPKCPIRYIITVNALKEGWDCPFAYVLISVANIGSRLAVEQTMGRIWRRPQASEKKNLDLIC